LRTLIRYFLSVVLTLMEHSLFDVFAKVGCSQTSSDLKDPQRLVYTLFICSIEKKLILEGPESRIEENISNLDVSENGFNNIHMAAYEDRAIVFINNDVKTFDISELMASGKVFLVSAGIGDRSAKYENFRVWKLP
ncbi:hypothetical protein, partial [Nostoc sp.]|uniref:hypothetical protein n=1 Tax=Nostoc sp. TaxID=1180 RepID=UPI002FF93A9D